MTIANSGPLSITDIVAEYGGSIPHSMSEYYRGGGLTDQGAPNVATSGAINLGSFYGAQLVVPGTQNFTTVGTTSFTVPVHNTITFELWGAGGSGGGGYNLGNGDPGGPSTISQLSLSAGGGAGGLSRNNGGGATKVAGGVASGGNDVNWDGERGSLRSSGVWFGGRDGRRLNLGLETNYSGDPYGTVDGGGGRGGYGNGEGGGGAGGAYVRSIYSAGVITPGTSLTIVVGEGGAGRFDSAAGEGGAGARGRIYISWS